MESVLEGRDDAEVTAAAAQRPEEIRLALGVRLDDGAVGEHDRSCDEVVDRKAARPRQVAHSAAKREPADARSADDPDRHGQAVLVRGVEDILEQRTAADTGQARGRVDGDFAHLREIDHEPFVHRAQAAAVVAAGADGNRQVVLPAVADSSGHVRLVDAVRDRGGPLVDHRVVQRA